MSYIILADITRVTRKIKKIFALKKIFFSGFKINIELTVIYLLIFFKNGGIKTISLLLIEGFKKIEM